MRTISGPAAAALRSLSANDIAFLQCLPKAELHAHLNGSIPLHTLQGLADKYSPSAAELGIDITTTVATLQSGFTLTEISDFFTLFPAIYALTATPCSSRRSYPRPGFVFNQSAPDCSYIELRTTPRATVHMDREQYLGTVLQEIKSFPGRAALIISVDRRMSETDVEECVNLAIKLRNEGDPVVGLDLCGDPLKGDVGMFKRHFKRAKEAGLGLTVHIAETPANTEAESHALLACHPDRLGHATFLTEEHQYKPCIEICLSSNLLCKTVPSLEAHHIRYYLANNHPVVICTDDTLPFRTTLLAEYALLLAKPPLGLGLSRDEVKNIAEMGMNARFMNAQAGDA
ncbi:Metallo-dependent hydrolase [Melanogaster broomeanus]|nr:Metallo-dependent hydrolase [Melanogaster broomeanus]